MNRTLKTALAGAMALGLTAAAGLAQEVTLRVHHFLSPAGSVPKFFIVPWAEKIMEESGGRINVEVYPAMQLGGSPPALYDQVRDGVVDVIWTVTGYTPGRFPEAEAMELPFITSMSAEDSSRAAWEFTEKYMQERFSDVHLVAVHVHGPGVVHKKGEPVQSAADFEGLKLRGPTRQVNKLLEALGATTVGMPVPQFPEALSRGVVDGGVIPWEVVPALKVEELADSHSQVSGDRTLYNTFFVFAMNPETYNRLPDDLKAVIDANSGIDASAWAGRAMDEGDTIAEAAITARGNTIVRLSEAAMEEMRSIGARVIEEWVAEMDAAGLPGAAMVEDARALVAQYARSGS